MVDPQDTYALLGAADVRELASALGIRPTKQLGQNFVHDAGTVRRIVAAAGLEPGTHVVEVGPGLGSLTLALLEAGMRVSAVELDRTLAAALEATVRARAPQAASRLRVVHADALSIAGADDIDRLTGCIWDAPGALVSNLPYNVSVPVLLTMIEAIPQIRRALVMVQREVAERLTAEPGSRTYGAPSAKLRWFGTVEMAGLIGRKVFWPEPHVDSALVRFTRDERFDPALRADTFTLIDHAFAQRRKTLRKALGGLLGGGEGAERALKAASIDPSARGETLAIDDFVALAEQARPGRSATATAPGKVNLLLEAARPDERGYHPLRTVFFGLDLFERVTVTPRLGDVITVTTRMVDVDGTALPTDPGVEALDPADHLAVRAIRALEQAAGRRLGCAIDVVKQVPVAGGMAGGSADAAAALRAGRRAFALDIDDEALAEIARGLGADVPFGLVGGAALGVGYGDHVTAIPGAAPRWFALALNERGIATPQLFAHFDACEMGRDRLESDLPDKWQAALADSEPDALAALMENDLQAAALDARPDLADVIAAADAAGALATLVSGSGPTIAALARDAAHAEQVAQAMAAAPGVSRTLVVAGPASAWEDR